MSRVKRGVVVKKRHKRLFKLSKGYWGQRKNIFKRAKETVLRALAFSFKGRKLRKRDFRSLFISRIKATTEFYGLKYNAFIYGLKCAHIELNRKVLSQIAIFDLNCFKQVCDIARAK
jgi:large subunit ribosomal protein L20